jgi:hypothetical protein
MQGIPEISQGQQPGNLPVVGPVVVPLMPGEVVRGEVINILPDAVSMRIKKEVILAKTDVPLQKGQAYLFRVESTGEEGIRLKVLQAITGEIDPGSPLMLDTLNRLKGSYLTHDQLGTLREVFDNMPESVRDRLIKGGAIDQLFKEANTLPNGLKAAIDSTGTFFETKLRSFILKWMETEGLIPGADPKSELAQIVQDDLKGTLLKMRQALSDPDTLSFMKQNGVSAEEVGTAVEKLIAHIELQQLESKQNGAFQTFLPFSWKGLKDGKMLFQESHHPKEGGSEYACVIHLDLEKAGKLTANLRLFSDHLHLRFVTDNARFRELIEANKPALTAQLSDAGILCHSLIVTQEKEIDFSESTVQGELDIKV